MRSRKPRGKNLRARDRGNIEIALRQLAEQHDISMFTLGNLAHQIGRGTFNVKRKEDQ